MDCFILSKEDGSNYFLVFFSSDYWLLLSWFITTSSEFDDSQSEKEKPWCGYEFIRDSWELRNIFGVLYGYELFAALNTKTDTFIINTPRFSSKLPARHELSIILQTEMGQHQW